ncbi:MAG: DUF2066 domain-containing protein [Idiomarina sp.]
MTAYSAAVTTKICALLTGLLCLLSATAAAVELDDLYEAQVSVYSQAQAERQRALEQVFEQMIVKVTGNSGVVSEDAVKQAKGQVSDYLVQYGYRTENSQQWLWASFDESKVNALLRTIDAPIWGNRRPRLMVWMAQEENDGTRDIIASDSTTVMKQQLLNRARERGVPVALPLMDLTDRMRVSVTDVWGRFEQPLQRAAQRYTADGLLMTRVYRSTNPDANGDWVFEWQAMVGNERIYGREVGNDPALMAAPLVDSVAEQLADLYGIRSSDAQSDALTIRVLQLDSIDSVLSVEKFLASLSIVKQVDLLEFGDGKAEFTLQLHGDAKRAQQTIGLDRRMQMVNENPFAAVASVPEYQWQN